MVFARHRASAILLLPPPLPAPFPLPPGGVDQRPGAALCHSQRRHTAWAAREPAIPAAGQPGGLH